VRANDAAAIVILTLLGTEKFHRNEPFRRALHPARKIRARRSPLEISRYILPAIGIAINEMPV
jgi:hypothetical protein